MQKRNEESNVIIETIYMLLKPQTKEMEQGLENVDRKADRTTEALTKTARAADRTNSSFKSLATSALGALGASTGLALALTKIADTARASEEVYRLSKAFGVSVEQLSGWGQALKSQGGTLEEFRMSLIAVGRQSGFSFSKIFNDLPNLVESLSGLDPSKGLIVLEGLGFDEKTAGEILKGKEHVLNIISGRLAVLTEKQAEDIHKLNKAWLETSGSFDKVSNTVLSDLAPSLTGLLETIKDFFKLLQENPDALKAITAGIITLTGALTLATLGWLTMTVAASPWLGIGYAIAAVFAAIVAGFFYFEEEIRTFGNWFGGFAGSIWDGIVAILTGDIDEIKKAFDDLFNYLEKAKDKFLESWKNSWIGNKIFEGRQAIEDLFNSPNRDLALSGANILLSAAANPISSISSNALGANKSNYNSTSVTTGNININTQATDARGISREIGTSLNNELRQSTANFDDGVAN